MVDREITEGPRIAELLDAEIDGRTEPPLDVLSIADRDPAADPSGHGGRIFDVHADGRPLAHVVVQPDRLSLEFVAGVEAAREAATDADLRVRPTASTPPRTLVFVETGAAVKRATDVLVAAAGRPD